MLIYSLFPTQFAKGLKFFLRWHASHVLLALTMALTPTMATLSSNLDYMGPLTSTAWGALTSTAWGA